MTAQSHGDLIQIIDETFLQHNEQCMFHSGNRTCVQFLTDPYSIGHKESTRSRCPPPRRLEGMRQKNMRNASLCGRGYYLASFTMQARYEKIIDGKRFNVCLY